MVNYGLQIVDYRLQIFKFEPFERIELLNS